MLYAAVTTTGSGWYPGAGVVTPTWMASRSCASVPEGEWHVVHHCCVKTATAIAGTAANGVVALEWHARHCIALCGDPIVTSKTMAALVGSCFPLLELVEYETDAGTFESAWHFRQRSEVSCGVAGAGQVRSGTAAWNARPALLFIWDCVWQPVQSIFAGSLVNAVWQLAHWN